MAFQFAYNPTNQPIPVRSWAYGSGGADIGGIIGYLQPQEQCCIIDYGGWGPYYRIGFFRGGSRYGINNGYTTNACIGDYRVIGSDPFSPMHSTGFRTGKANGQRKSYWTFNVRQTTGLYKRIGANFYQYQMSLYPGDKIGLVNGKYLSGSNYGHSHSAVWDTGLLGIDTFTSYAYQGGDVGGFPWQDNECYNNDWYVDTGHKIGRTARDRCNIYSMEIY